MRVKPEEELRTLYRSHIEPEYRLWKKKGRTIVAIAALVPLSILLVIIFWFSIGWFYNLLVIIMLSGLSIYLSRLYDNLIRDFKYRIVGEAIRLINANYKLSYPGNLSLKSILRTGLYFETPDSSIGHGSVTGQIGQTDFELTQVTTKLSGANNETVLFSGFFLKIDINRNLNSKVYVFPDTGGRLRGNSRRDLKKELGPWLKLPADFREHFSVFSENADEAYQLVGPNMRKSLIALKEQLKVPFNLVFHENQIFCTLSYNKKLFEPGRWYWPSKIDFATE